LGFLENKTLQAEPMETNLDADSKFIILLFYTLFSLFSVKNKAEPQKVLFLFFLCLTTQRRTTFLSTFGHRKCIEKENKVVFLQN
jgi:hypothetical protein